MRLSCVRLPLLAATVWIGLGFSVSARDIRFGETVFVTPTSTTFSLAPSYLVSTSYVRPTAYVVPSSYSTAYVVPSSYYSAGYVVPSSYSTTYIAEPLALLPTTYVATTYRRGLLGRRWLVERPVIASYGTTYIPSSYATTYVPSSYVFPSYYATSYRVRTYAPTVTEYPAVWETASVIRRGDCDEVAWAPPVSSPATSSLTRPRASTSTNAAQIDLNEDPTIPSNVDPLRVDERTPARTPGSDAATKAQAPATGRADSPPAPPAAEQGQTTPKSQTNQPAPKASGGTGGNAGAAKPDADAAAKAKAALPAAPAGEQNDIDLKPAPGAEGSGTIRRDVSRPVYSTRALRPERRNILIGRVESSAGEPQGEVPVSVTSRSNSVVHHDGLTNAFGGFAIRLTDGEWTVNVTMPSGRVYPVRSVTVSNGKVLDNQEGREVQSLVITY